MIEIEKKFQVENFDKVRDGLTSGDFDVMEKHPSEYQSDNYFNHRQLRFELQDIALRIRQVDDRNVLTFKGPNQDADTKIRQEIEVDLVKEDAEKISQMFFGMGMLSVAEVSKYRETIIVRWEGVTVRGLSRCRRRGRILCGIGNHRRKRIRSSCRQSQTRIAGRKIIAD